MPVLPIPTTNRRKPADAKEETKVVLRDGEEPDPGPQDGDGDADTWEPEADSDEDADGDNDGEGEGDGDVASPPARPAAKPVSKAVDITANDVLSAINAAVDSAFEKRIEPIIENNRALVKAYGDVVAQLNVNTNSVDAIYDKHEALVKSVTDQLSALADLPTLTKSVTADLAAREEAAPQNAGAVVTTTATAIEPGAVLTKAGVATPELQQAAVTAPTGVMTAEEQAEYPRVMAKAMSLSERGIAVTGLSEVMAFIDNGRMPLSKSFQLLKTGITTAKETTTTIDNTGGW